MEFSKKEIGRAQLFTLFENDAPLSTKEVMTQLSSNSAFRKFYNEILKNSDYEAFFWENKPVTAHNLSDAYEFALVESDALKSIHSSPNAFEEKFSDAQVVVFPNLSGDATLIVPCPKVDHSVYAHLAQFVRNADENQIDAFWKYAAQTLLQKVNDVPIWMSTAGLGVSWLHLRIDQRPKYYRHQPFKTIAT